MFSREGFVRKGKRFLRDHLVSPARHGWWHLYGHTLRNPEFHVRPSSLLFVCKGNICRSPFAERLFRKHCEERSAATFLLSSAGFEVTTPCPSPATAVAAARQFGVSLEDHRSARLTEDMIERYEMVLVMEVAHLDRLRKAFPARRGTFFLLPLLSSSGKTGAFDRFNIDDPYGQDLDFFLECFGKIARCVDSLVDAVGGGS